MSNQLHRQILLTLFLVTSCSVGTAVAQITVRSTGDIPLDGSRGSGPDFTLPGVVVNKTLTVNKATGVATQKCQFKNNGAARVDFLFCDMVSLNSSFPTTDSFNTCNLSFVGGQWKCVAGSGAVHHPPASFHFGCTEVHLNPGQSVTTPPKNGFNADFVGKFAWDFQVSYADIFDLRNATFDATSCITLGCFGANTDTNFDAVPTRAGGTGFWVLQKLPITDPYVVWQDPQGVRHRREYAPLSVGLSLPSEFPAQVEDLGRTSPETQPPLTLTQDLNLWDIYTMSAPPDEVTEVEITPFARGTALAAGVRVEVFPRQALIAGDSMDFGTLAITRPAAHEVPEGARLELGIAFSTPGDPRRALWLQSGNLIQDTDPPIVLEHRENLQGTRLDVMLNAADRTTSPVAANLWYSLDDGLTWVSEELTPTIDPLELPTQNVFRAAIELAGPPDRPVQFFYSAQDCVYNNVFFGPFIIRPFGGFFQ